MDRSNRGFDIFPLIDNDEVQTIMDFRPNPPGIPSTSTSRAVVEPTLPTNYIFEPSSSTEVRQSPKKLVPEKSCKKRRRMGTSGSSSSKRKGKYKKGSASKRKSHSTPLNFNLTDTDSSNETLPMEPDSGRERSRKRYVYSY